MSINFSQVSWGPDEAKGDPNLHRYFYAVEGFQDIQDGGIRYVIGRKGAGKTAIVERVKAASADDPLCFYSELSLRDFPVNSFAGLQDKSKTDKSKYVAAWEFIIYVELARLVLKDMGGGGLDAIEELEFFLRSNKLDSDVGFSETVTYLNSTKFQVTAKASWLSAGFSSSGSEQQLVKVHYTKIVKALSTRLLNVSSDSVYRIFFDELDEGYSASDDRLKNILLALIRAVENSALAVASSNLKFYPLLVLRSDIHDSLEDNDLNKIHDYALKLRWSQNPEINDETSMSLRSVVNSRILASIPQLDGVPDPWLEVVNDDDVSLPSSVDSIWKYVANRTYERPRDIIKFLKISRRYQKTGLLTFHALEKAELDYSDWLYGEIKDELQSHLSVWGEALGAITKIGVGRFSCAQLCEALTSDKKICAWMEDNSASPVDIVGLLFRFGVLGNLDEKRWLFGYKDGTLSFNEDMDLILHYGLHKKLRIGKRLREYLDYEAYN